MFTVFKKYINQKSTLTDQEWSLIESVSTFKKLRKHQFLLQEGDIWNFNAFICEGCLRRYHIDEKGNEHTLQFSIENWWTGDRESLNLGTPSKFNIEAIENSVVLLIHKDQFEMICEKIPAFNTTINSILQKSMTVSLKRIQADISLTAEDKYLHFVQTSPQLANRVPRNMLASYLGISPETLSRIRRLTAKK